MSKYSYNGNKGFQSSRKHRDSNATLVDEPCTNPPPRPRSCLKSNNCDKRDNRCSKRVQFDVIDYVQSIQHEEPHYRSDDSGFSGPHLHKHAPTNYASQLPPDAIPYHIPIIVYPAHNKEKKKDTMYKRFKKAFAAITFNPDEALLGCRPGKPTAAYMLRREERLAELAELERKAKDRPRTIIKWSEILLLEEEQEGQQQLRSQSCSSLRNSAHPICIADKGGDKRSYADSHGADNRGTSEPQRAHVAYQRRTDLRP